MREAMSECGLIVIGSGPGGGGRRRGFRIHNGDAPVTIATADAKAPALFGRNL